MEWSILTRIDLNGLNYSLGEEAKLLNRRLEDLEKYRAGVGNGTVKRILGRPGEQVDEAMRREVMLRYHITGLNKKAKRDNSENEALYAAARKFLDERGTHTTRAHGGF